MRYPFPFTFPKIFMNRLLLLLGAAGLLLTAGCRKDDVVDCAPTPVPPPPPTASSLTLAEFTRRNSVPGQTFTLVMGQDQTITTKAGATLSFLANSFTLPNGTLATGLAQVRIREIYSVPEMVLANMPTTVANQSSQGAQAGRLLVSGGEFSIKVWQNSVRLRLSQPMGSAGVVVQSPRPSDQDTTRQLSWQQPAAKGPDSLGWYLNTAPVVPSNPGTSISYRVTFPLDSIGWWNIDQYWSKYQNTTTAQVEVPTAAYGETRVYLRPIGYNGLARTYIVNGSSNTRWQATMPIGAEMVAVVLQSINGQLYYGTQRATVQSGFVFKPTLTAVSEAEAVRLIRQL